MNQSNDLTLDLRTEQSLVPSGVPAQRILEVRVRAPQAGSPVSRSPLNLALVLDRSGSMSGEKLAFVQRAARHVLDLLDERDQAALVAYDNEISLLSPSTPVTPGARSRLQERIDSLKAGATTNLSGGWFEGLQQVAGAATNLSLNRALLLTDGLANEGITDLETLCQHAKELARRGVSTSTFGVGEGFNEYLLEGIANQGGGSFYFIDLPQRIPEIFVREFHELQSVTARQATLSLQLPPQFSAGVLGGWRTEQDGVSLHIYLGDLLAGREQVLYIRLLTPPQSGSLPAELHLLASLEAKGEDNQPFKASGELVFTYAPADQAAAPGLRSVLEGFARAEMAEAAAEALRLERQGQNQQAKAVLMQSLAASAPYMPAADSAVYKDMADNLQHGLAESDRKIAHYQTYTRRKGKDKSS